MTTRRIESVQERSASARVCPERAIRLPFSGASVALIGGTLTAYASTEQMAMTLVGRIALLATAIAMLGLSALEQRRESESGSSAAHWWATVADIRTSSGRWRAASADSGARSAIDIAVASMTS